VARHEIAQAKHFDYLIVSQTMEEDLQRMQAIITAEKLRQSRSRLPEYEPSNTLNLA
jgi:guanylate kinase